MFVRILSGGVKTVFRYMLESGLETVEAGLKSGNAGSYSLIIYDLTAENEDK
ncbi:hypothetical protein ISS30_11025, partial [bacterium]|nr:hypothetical protein [bacterium]